MDKPTGRQLAAARTLLGLTQSDVAHRSNVSVPTLKRMEASEGMAAGMANNIDAVVRTLESTGIQFIPENGGGPGVRLHKLRPELEPLGVTGKPAHASGYDKAPGLRPSKITE